MRKRLGLCVAMFLAALGVSGCGASKYVSVEGTVNLDGQPLEGALVSFAKMDGTTATGVTSATGKFKLLTTGNEGALPGTYKVTISKLQNLASGITTEGVDPTKAYEEYAKKTGLGGKGQGGGKGPQQEKPKSEVPERYSKNGSLPDQIVPAAGPIVIDLKSK